MICPYCSQSFPLTWSRYVRAPFGKHTCPACGKSSRLKLTASYVAVLLTASLVYYGIAFAMAVIVFGGRWQQAGLAYIAGAIVIGCALLIPFDKYFDDKHRKLKKLAESAEQRSGDTP